MIQSVWVKNPNGDRLDLNLKTSDTEEGLVVFNITGLGPPVATVNGTGGPNFDGLRVTSVRADARHIVLTIAVSESGMPEEEARKTIYKYFPGKQMITLGIATETKDLVIPAYVETNEFNQFAQVENAVISLMSPMPYFAEQHELSILLYPWRGVPTFEFPFCQPWLDYPRIQFGWYAYTGPTTVIDYERHVTTGITILIDLFSYVHHVEILNTNGNQVMTLDFSGAEAHFGSIAQEGDQVLINTRVGLKSALYRRGSEWFNMINGVGIYDDWIELRPGENVIIATAGMVIGDPSIDNAEVNIQFNALSEGV